ncbi:TetR/AcrR family transcriptional regulator [Paenibacillus sp. J5C_2022]|nr:TetR/AcrR family transcriptional regulator [Paenibacillus sp. J5C2022]
MRKKQAIMKAALELSNQYGADKIGMAEIAKHAGVSPVTVYNYFGDKTTLIRVAVLDVMERTLERYEAILEQPGSFLSKFHQVLTDRHEISNYAGLIGGQADSVFQQLEPYWHAFYEEKTLPFFKKLIAMGQQEGCVDSSLSMQAVIMYIQMFKEQLAKPGFLGHADNVIYKELEHLFYYGLVGGKREQDH